MAEGMSVTQNLNRFNIIINQLSYIEIKFDNEIRVLILLTLLPNGWEIMRMTMSNSAKHKAEL